MKTLSFCQKIKSPLSKKLLLTILISSTVITFITLAIQLYFEYKTDIELIEKRISQIENSYTKALALSVWNFNKNQYEIQLDGILNLEDIVYVEIVSPDNQKIISKGIYQESQKITQEFVLQSVDFGQRVTSGKLMVVASLERVYDNLYNRAFIILVTQGIKTLFVSFIILYAFYLLVTRHLYTISEYAKNIDLDSKEKLDLQRKNENDELDNIVFALNNMQDKINHGYKKIETQKKLYDLVFEKSSNGVLMIDAKTEKFIECNDRIVTILKANSKDDVLNMHPSQLSPKFQPDGRRSDEKSKEMIQKALDKGVNTFEWKHIRSDGEEFWAEVILTKIILNESVLIYVTWKDIDSEKRAQLELVEKSALLAKANTQLQESQYKLQQANKNLESKVQERTQELQELNLELTKLSNIDPMTGAYNRRYFYSKVEELIPLSTPLTLAMIDIDNFKNINDTYGHDIGDDVIRALVTKINSIIRKSDLLIRFGGEEFIILFAHTNAKDSQAILEKIRKSIEQSNHVDSIFFTVSIGVSEFEVRDKDIDATIKRADERLYLAKRNGKNQIVMVDN